MTRWELEWSHGQGFIDSLGGMLGPVWFRVGDDRDVQPFAVFPWREEVPPPGEAPLTGLMMGGGGEWPCVPFGIAADSPEAGWHPSIHGESAHGEWARTDDGRDPARAALRFRCGPSGPIDTLEREIVGVAGKAAIRLRLTVRVRRPCRLPVGLHPMLKMPATSRRMSLHPGHFEFALTYPHEVEAGADVVASGTEFSDLREVPGRNGGTVDLSAYPLRERTESLVQLCGIDGRFSVLNDDEGYQLDIAWPCEMLPSCVLWISNGGRRAWPWSGRHFALGVEPVCAAFDLGVAASQGANRISERGVATTMHLRPETPITLDYWIGVSATNH
ncbi:hypothetical protein QZM22_00670 [Burkholderia oklahomensis]|uniref:hypothetical protein n=1 Tax=Burkholderia oklahomensis TaxID=342113 RepID=UPI00264E53DA|nr:hypothetical protein [Burkholderia oklahomensis]MDN7671074.1 hypothetical protein [Burkholderia oklahomensis]